MVWYRHGQKAFELVRMTNIMAVLHDCCVYSLLCVARRSVDYLSKSVCESIKRGQGTIASWIAPAAFQNIIWIIEHILSFLHVDLLLPKAASYSWRCVIAHLNFPPTVLYTWSVSRFCVVQVFVSSCDVKLWRCSKEFTLEHYHTPGVYDSKSTTAESLYSDLRTTYHEWRLNFDLQFCGI
jgi:hypothetical protein